MTQEIAEIGMIVGEYQADRSALIQVLLEIQRQNRWLPKEALKQISQSLGVPLTQIYHIASFYKGFSLKPKGRHSVTVCLGTACLVRGASRLLDMVTENLKIKEGETSQDMQFSLDTVRCLGCCALGPVMVVDDEYYGKPTGKEITQITSAKAIES